MLQPGCRPPAADIPAPMLAGLGVVLTEAVPSVVGSAAVADTPSAIRRSKSAEAQDADAGSAVASSRPVGAAPVEPTYPHPLGTPISLHRAPRPDVVWGMFSRPVWYAWTLRKECCRLGGMQ